MTAGQLLVVGTPIGNLGDLSPRAKEALATADAIACEDTRRTGRLLMLSGIERRPLLIVNEHTELARADEVIQRVSQGETIALVSDAGMPAVSDPGQRLVSTVLDAGLRVAVVPGPTAAVSALVLSGLPSKRFVMEGFLARKGRERENELAAIAEQSRTTIVYESPKRVLKTLIDLAAACGSDRRAAIGRELTKLHETVERGTLAELVELVRSSEPRGEYVIVVEGQRQVRDDLTDQQLVDRIDAGLAAGQSRRDVVTSVVAETGVQKRRVYELAISRPTPEGPNQN